MNNWPFYIAMGLLIAALAALVILAPNTQAASACNAKELETIRLFNVERAKATALDGIVRPPLRATDLMCQVADLRCTELLRKTSHFRPVDVATQDAEGRVLSMTPDGKLDWFNSAYNQLGQTYTKAGEVIAWGYSTPAGVVGAWMRSSTHKAVILTKRYTDAGVGWCGSTWSRTAGEFAKP